jgi:hypothetical protein
MKSFLGEDFLLDGEAARRLYFDYTADEPIHDYHSHLDPADIATDRRFDNLSASTSRSTSRRQRRSGSRPGRGSPKRASAPAGRSAASACA